MNIEQVKSIEELNEIFEFFKIVYPKIDFSQQRFLGQWTEHLNKNPELLLYARDGDIICAATLGTSGEGDKHIMVGEGVLDEYWNTGIFEALFIELEKRAKKSGYIYMGVAIGEGQEEFYAKLGFTGRMLIQSEKHSIDDLKKVIEGNKNIELSHTRIHDGYINQLWLHVSILDKELKKKFEQDLGDCWCQIIVGKGI